MDIRQNILLIDGIAASCAGVAVISSTNWLQGLYQLPEELLVSVALINLSYAVLFSVSFNDKKPIDDSHHCISGSKLYLGNKLPEAHFSLRR